MRSTKRASEYYDLAAEYKTNGKIPDYKDLDLKYDPSDLVWSCPKLESGLRLGDDGIRACCMGAIVSPLFWSADEADAHTPSKDEIITKRKTLFKAVNDPASGNLSCKSCHMLKQKQFKDVDFTRLGHVNLAHYSICNLRCSFCGFTQYDIFTPPQYDALTILQAFQPEDVEWDSFVDLNGGEPTLLRDLEKYLDYFTSRSIRILLYTNAVHYNQEIYNGLLSGAITWVITSLDAGTPSSFKYLKGRDKFEAVIENLTRYAKAGSEGKGNLAVKYIFSENNCGNDDITGFSYSMLAIRPQKVWLTFDFFPLADTYEGQEEAGVYDYSKHIEAYIKMFTMLRKHGLEPAHFAKTHLAQIMQEGKDLISAVEEGISATLSEEKYNDPNLFLADFRVGQHADRHKVIRFQVNPFVVVEEDGILSPYPLEKKRVVLAPAYELTNALLADSAVDGAEILGFIDRNPVLHGKVIQGYPIYDYQKLSELNPDVVLVAAPEQHEAEIISDLMKELGDDAIILALKKRS